MNYDVIAKIDPQEVKITTVGKNDNQKQLAVFNRVTPGIFVGEVRVSYEVTKVGRGHWLTISGIVYEENGETNILNPSIEKYLPEEILEELAYLVTVHNADGVWWNQLSKITVFDRNNYPDQHLVYKMVPETGSVPRVTFHDVVGEYFYKEVNGLVYRTIPKDVVKNYIDQANSLKSNVGTPEWFLKRDKVYNYTVPELYKSKGHTSM